MYTIRLKSGQHLDLKEGEQIGFEMNNAVFNSGNSSVLPGSFTIPLELPTTGNNLSLLDHPQLVTTPGRPAIIPEVWVYAGGTAMFYGELIIRNANARRIVVNIIANPIGSIKETALNEIDLGGDRAIGTNNTDRKLHFRDTLDFPENHDYIFAQLYNTFFFGDEKEEPYTWQNKWDEPTQDFDLSGETITPSGGHPVYYQPRPIMPMVKVSYLLKRLVESGADGWTLVNEWQLTEELQRLVLISLFSIWEAPTTGSDTARLPDTVDLRQHVSKTKGNDFLKKVAATFRLGIFTNIFEKKIYIIPLQEVLKRSTKHDWTIYAINDPVIEFAEQDIPLLICLQEIAPSEESYRAAFKQKDLTPYNIDKEITLPSYRRETDHAAALAGLADGLYYIETTESVYQVFTLDGNKNRRRLGRLRRCVSQGKEPVFYVPLEIPLTFQYVGPASQLTPYINRPGSSVDKTDPANNLWERSSADNPDAIMFYRGIQALSGSSGSIIPYCSIHQYSPAGEVLAVRRAQIVTDGVSIGEAQHSLLMVSESDSVEALYQDWWENWHIMVKENKPVTQRFTIPVSIFTQFNFQDKVRVGNMDYFIKSLSVQRLTSDRHFVVEANMFSTI